ncbi:MAG: hypothetical protein CL831_10730 [Crocinitomicaceae bacterium]|nr:hypothetical protein [Crocinitomicaceae bacterium]
MRTLPPDDQSIQLEHYGTTRYQVNQATNKKYFDELLHLRDRISIPVEANSINVELSKEELVLAWNLLESIPNLFDTVKRHLGGEFLVMEAYHFVASNYNKQSKVSTSGFWHRDSIGRRIKIFICLQTTGHSPVTAVLPCTYLDPIPRGWEMLRAAISSTANSNVTTEPMNNLNSTFEKFNQVDQSYTQGDIVLLDTNAIHRGIYSDYNNQKDSYRHLLQISLIPKTTLDLQRMLNSVCWAQKDVKYPVDLFDKIPLHTPPFYKDK